MKADHTQDGSFPFGQRTTGGLDRNALGDALFEKLTADMDALAKAREGGDATAIDVARMTAHATALLQASIPAGGEGAFRRKIVASGLLGKADPGATHVRGMIDRAIEIDRDRLGMLSPTPSGGDRRGTEPPRT